MDTIIVTMLGMFVGLLVSRPPYSKQLDILTGAFGALAVYSFSSFVFSGYSPYSLLVIMIGALTVIYGFRVFVFTPVLKEFS